MPFVTRRRALVASLVAAPMSARAAPAFLEALFAPAARLWPRWQAHDANSTRVVDHAAWAGFLTRYTARRSDLVMGVRYRDVTQSDRSVLLGYLGDLSATPVSSLNRDEQFAFWTNLYNALTMRVVLDHYPVASIRDITLSGGLFASGPWSAKLMNVEDEALSLNDIEHRILRPIWRDARVHYAVNCASVGCPDLWPTPFSGSALVSRLDRAARAFVGHPRGVTATADGLRLSSIYNWFADDFGDEAGLRAHLGTYAAPDARAVIERAGRIVAYQYDWRLNDLV
jgi:hypothetical protein